MNLQLNYPFLLLICALFLGCQKRDLSTQNPNQIALRDSLMAVLAIDFDTAFQPDIKPEWYEQRPEYTIEKFSIIDDQEEKIPAYLLTPEGVEQPCPVMICLQGHAPGMYISIGEVRGERDSALIAGGRDLALQAVDHGWAALVVEQKGFGERAIDGISCNYYSLNEMMQGRTMLGQRARDISTAVNYIRTRPDLEQNKIGCIGNSSGGTTTFFAACIDTRINLSVVSCSFSTYATSWLKYPHCACGYVPGMLEVGDMPDLAALIAPRKLIIVAGVEDYLADIEGVREGYQTAKRFYEEAGAPENIMLIEGPEGHQFYPKLTWPEIDKFKNRIKM